jgi:hypothetical protein
MVSMLFLDIHDHADVLSYCQTLPLKQQVSVLELLKNNKPSHRRRDLLLYLNYKQISPIIYFY